MAIANVLIGPSHPGAHPALVACIRELGEVDRVLLPWELLAESQLVFDGALKAARKFVRLHDQIQTVRIYTRYGYGQVAGRMADAIYAYAQEQGLKVRVKLEMLACNGEQPTATIFACGDGREWFCREFPNLFARYGTPRIISFPGERAWMKDHPAIGTVVDEWLASLPGVPRVVVKHGGPPCEDGGSYHGCGYRRAGNSALARSTPQAERALALAECDEDDVEYLWAPGHGSEFLQVLRPRRLGGC